MASVNTNNGALQAVQALNTANADLRKSERRLTTGLRVASAKDDGATYAIALGMRTNAASLTTVNDSLRRAQSAIEVALSAGETVSDALSQMKELSLAALDQSLDSTSRSALVEQHSALKAQIVRAIDSAEFDGINLLKSPDISSFLADESGTGRTDIPGQDWSYTPASPGPVIKLRGYSLDTITYATYSLTDVDQTIPKVTQSLSYLGTAAKQIEASITFNAKLQDTLMVGVSNLVDADLAKESAKIEAGQARQSLAQKSLAIANAAPQWIANLFR